MDGLTGRRVVYQIPVFRAEQLQYLFMQYKAYCFMKIVQHYRIRKRRKKK